MLYNSFGKNNQNYSDIKATMTNDDSENLLSESFRTNLDKMDNFKIVRYNDLDLNRMYFQNPKELVAILEIIKIFQILEKHQ